jgi:hypothetical protein
MIVKLCPVRTPALKPDELKSASAEDGVAGSDSNTEEGIVNLPADAGAVQMKVAPA